MHSRSLLVTVHSSSLWSYLLIFYCMQTFVWHYSCSTNCVTFSRWQLSIFRRHSFGKKKSNLLLIRSSHLITISQYLHSTVITRLIYWALVPLPMQMFYFLPFFMVTCSIKSPKPLMATNIIHLNINLAWIMGEMLHHLITRVSKCYLLILKENLKS